MNKNNVPLSRYERVSYQRHRRQFFWNILVPVVLASLFGLAAAILMSLSAFGGEGDVARWGAIATIWLSIPATLGLLVTMGLSVGIVYGLGKLLKRLPTYTGLAQDYSIYYNLKIVEWTDKLINPVLKVESWIELLIGFVRRSQPKSEKK